MRVDMINIGPQFLYEYWEYRQALDGHYYDVLIKVWLDLFTMQVYQTEHFTSMSKTKEEILQRRYVTDKGFERAERYIYNSMDEWGQQKVDEFKEKLKIAIWNRYQRSDFQLTITGINKDIDNL